MICVYNRYDTSLANASEALADKWSSAQVRNVIDHVIMLSCKAPWSAVLYISIYMCAIIFTHHVCRLQNQACPSSHPVILTVCHPKGLKCSLITY